MIHGLYSMFSMPKLRKGSKGSGSHTTSESPSERAESSAGNNVEEVLRMLIDDRQKREEEIAEER